jgi:hypothetical protein
MITPPSMEAAPKCSCIPEYIELLWNQLIFKERIKYFELHIKHKLNEQQLHCLSSEPK